MSEDPHYQQLLEDYRKLQLRVTRFSATEQELINTRDRLDSELLLYKRLHEFNLQALTLSSQESFFRFTTEYIVDLFEVEVGLIMFSRNVTGEILFFKEGNIALTQEQEGLMNEWGKRFLAMMNEHGEKRTVVLYNQDFSKVLDRPSTVELGICYKDTDPDGLHSICLAGIVTKANAPLYAIQPDRIRTIFSVFAQQVIAISQNRRKTEELRKINSELDNFVYSVSHDLRSPLLSVKGILSLVFDLQQIEPEAEQYLRMAETSINRLDGIIQEILTYSRNSRMEVQPEWLNVEEMAEEVYEDIRFSTESQVRFIKDIQTDSLIYSDHARVNVLLRNIIGNAVKYRNKKIKDQFVKFRLFSEDQQLVMEVSDNGEGIPADRIDKIFDMFYRGTKNSTGTGLGLYIVKEIIIKMNGHIHVDSSEGEGTTFTIRLPILNPKV